MSEYLGCPSISGDPDCKYYAKESGCHETVHHVYFPSTDYKGCTEKIFRNLPENKEILCRRLHDIVHVLESPPEKPTREDMVERISVSGVALSIHQQRIIYGEV